MINTLHLGENIVLCDREIIGIFSDLPSNSGLLGVFSAGFALRNVTENKRSFVLVKKSGKNYVYYSKISGRNLIKRLKAFSAEAREHREEVHV